MSAITASKPDKNVVIEASDVTIEGDDDAIELCGGIAVAMNQAEEYIENKDYEEAYDSISASAADLAALLKFLEDKLP